jgi:hypothetical protein
LLKEWVIKAAYLYVLRFWVPLLGSLQALTSKCWTKTKVTVGKQDDELNTLRIEQHAIDTYLEKQLCLKLPQMFNTGVEKMNNI